MELNDNQKAFFALLKAGLWERKTGLLSFDNINYTEITKLADEQSVLGLVAAGLEQVLDVNAPKEEVLNIVGWALQIEQRNQAMNNFLGLLIEKMRNVGICAILIKGQGVAQSYEKPLWRSCGDIDLLLSSNNYNKASSFLSTLASKVDEENKYNQHLAMIIDPWVVELHGTMRSDLWGGIDKTLDSIQNSIFFGGSVRSWMNGNTQIFLPGVNEDIVFVFSHILQHFFRGGIGLRQICDWCRLMWTYKDKINNDILENRLKSMGVMTEWKAFAALAVDWLGMPSEIIPLYSSSKKWSDKANRIIDFVLETGNFGHNRDKSYYKKHSFLGYKAISLWRNTSDSIKHFMIFPWDAIKVWLRMVRTGVSAVVKKK